MAERGSIHGRWNVSAACIEPLYNVTVGVKDVIVTVDMPFVNARKVKLGCSEDNLLEVYAETSRTITFKALGAKHRHGEFKSYHARIRLPVRINDKKITSRFKRGVLELHLPRAK